MGGMSKWAVFAACGVFSLGVILLKADDAQAGSHNLEDPDLSGIPSNHINAMCDILGEMAYTTIVGMTNIQIWDKKLALGLTEKYMDEKLVPEKYKPQMRLLYRNMVHDAFENKLPSSASAGAKANLFERFSTNTNGKCAGLWAEQVLSND